MSPWLIAIVAGVVFGLAQYGRDVRAGFGALSAALLRGLAVTLVVALLLDAQAGRARPVAPWVALDASASWLRRGDSAAWVAARPAVAAAKAASVFLFGASLRPTDSVPLPSAPTSLVRPAVERALGRGHPLLVVTDGERDDRRTRVQDAGIGFKFNHQYGRRAGNIARGSHRHGPRQRRSPRHHHRKCHLETVSQYHAWLSLCMRDTILDAILRQAQDDSTVLRILVQCSDGSTGLA